MNNKEQVSAIQRYKIGYHTDEWGMRSGTPAGIHDASGSWVRYSDHVAVIADLRAQHARIAELEADAIRAGWRPARSTTAEGGIKWQRGPLVSGFTAPHPAAIAMAGSQPAPDEIINMAREQGLPETEIEGVFRVNADDLCRVAAAIEAKAKKEGEK